MNEELLPSLKVNQNRLMEDMHYVSQAGITIDDIGQLIGRDTELNE
jgi:hypothetical protein